MQALTEVGIVDLRERFRQFLPVTLAIGMNPVGGSGLPLVLMLVASDRVLEFTNR
jgi:hypothetical protein